MGKPLLLLSFIIVFSSFSLSVLAVDVSKTTGLSGDMTSSYATYSVNFGDTYSSIGSVCFDFAFSGDLLDPNENLAFGSPSALSGSGFINVGNTPQATRTICYVTPGHQTVINEFLDGVVTGSIRMNNGTVFLQSLAIRLLNAVSATSFNFSLSSNPTSGTVIAGNSTTTTVSSTLTSGSTQSVSLSCSGLPSGASCSFSPLSCNPTCSSTVTISTSSSTPTGTYAVTISGVGGGITRTSSYSLTVSSAPTTTCPTCPSPTTWSTCVNNNQSRTNYKCDATTGYQCQSYTETQSCTSTVNQTCPTCLPPTAWNTCTNNAQTRTNYKCDSTTNYICQTYTETQSCTSPPPVSKVMQITINIPKTTYYPNENFEPKVTVTDSSGKLITDATVYFNFTVSPKSYYRNTKMFYSYLCDCYKTLLWIDESSVPGDYVIPFKVTHPNFETTFASVAIKLVKPTIETFTITTDKKEYSAGDTITATITAKDPFGNVIKDLYITGELRDADTGKLVSAIYPYISGDVYTYTYHTGSESLGKSYKFVVSTKWKEQTKDAEATVSIVKRGLNADVVLEKNILSPKDSLKGRIKVYDKDGNAVKDAVVDIQMKDSQGFASQYISTTYKDGFYEIQPWLVQDWVSVGNYTLEIKIGKHPEDIMLTRSIEITKQKLNVDVILDKTSYRPNDKVYMKILVAYPDGKIAKDAWVSAEIFPLVAEPFGEKQAFYQPGACRVYASPIPPVYYKGEFIQKYFIDSPYIPTGCPTGKYALKVIVNAQGYADAEIFKEFDVALAKLFIETGFSVDSQVDSVNLAIYADVKDEDGNPVEFATIEGILRPPEESQGCIRRFSLYYDTFLRRYSSNEFVSRYECPAGNYIIQLRASSPSYETAEVVQGVVIQYKQGYEYSAYIPATPTGSGSVCREASCGINCIQKICEAEMPLGDCFNLVVDDECINACTQSLEKIEQEISTSGESATIEKGDFEDCINKCTIKVACQGSGIPVVPLEVMIDKLNELRKEVAETKEEVSGLKQILLAIIDFVNSILQKYLGQQQAITVPSEAIQNATTNQTSPITGAVAALIKSLAR